MAGPLASDPHRGGVVSHGPRHPSAVAEPCPLSPTMQKVKSETPASVKLRFTNTGIAVANLLQRHAADLDRRIRELQQLRGEVRQLAQRASALDPEHCPPERVCHIIT